MTRADDPNGVELAKSLSRWLRLAGVPTTEMSVDFADTITAARSVEADLDVLLKLDPTQAGDADTALRLLGRIHTWLFTEIKYHVLELERNWPQLEDQIAILSPDTD